MVRKLLQAAGAPISRGESSWLSQRYLPAHIDWLQSSGRTAATAMREKTEKQPQN